MSTQGLHWKQKNGRYPCEDCDKVLLSRAGLTGHIWWKHKYKQIINEEEWKTIMREYLQGNSLMDLARRYDCSPGTISYHLRKQGVKIRRLSASTVMGFIKHNGRQLMIPKEEWKIAYLAGLIDGEGSIMLTKQAKGHGLCVNVQVVNTDLKMIDWIRDNFGGKTESRLYPSGVHQILRTMYAWRIRNIPLAHKLLSSVMPYLITKRNVAEVAHKYCGTWMEKADYPKGEIV